MSAHKILMLCMRHEIPVVIVGQRKNARGLVVSVDAQVAIIRDSVDASKTAMGIHGIKRISRFDSRVMFDASESDGSA